MPNKRNSFIPTIEFTTPRRSPRFLHQRTTTVPPLQPKTPRKAEDSKAFTSKSTRKSVCYSNPPPPPSSVTVQIALSPQSHKDSKNNSSKKSNDSGRKFGNGNTAPSELRRSSRLNDGAGGFPCPRRSFRLSRRKIRFLELRDSPRRGKGEQMTKGVFMTREKFKIEALVKGKRKKDENSEAAQNGWTKEQEVALRRAYFVAKPTPHFWKKVSKLVPGKSAHDCFERIHQDHLTPPQHQPRSRAKKLKSSPVEEVLLSASKLLKPIVNEARKSSRSKSKSYLTQKSLRKLLQRNQKVGPDHEGDLFSVLEPNVDFPTNAFPLSDAHSTPEKLDEKQGWLQSCNEKSSSRQGKALSRFNSSFDSDIVSPPVLKQVKNRVLHEKYINQLRFREARRRAASARVEMFKLGKAVSKESNVQKGGVVESAKIALVSEARDAIKKFQYSQANLMNSCNSDEYIDDHVEAESCDDEDESQKI
ncbi:hypothetical protein K1719_003625 [Acacia pycnantha]|nr:hypothetical protein K1719_003625 [Acacia pycnantha]